MRSKAFSLPELLVALGIGAVVLGILVALVVWGMRLYAVQSVENQRFQLGSLVVKRLRADLRASCDRGVSVLSEPGRATIAIHRLDDVTATGAQKWADAFVVYHFENGRVQRGTWGPVASTARPQRLKREELRALTLTEPVPLMDEVESLQARLDGRTFSADLVTLYRVPRKSEPGRQEFHTSLSLRDNP